MVVMLNLREVVAECMQALDDEVDAIKRFGTKPIRLFDGELLGIPEGAWLYRFTTDEDVVLPDNSRAEIIVNEARYDCTVIAVEGFHILLVSDPDLGEEIPEARLDVDLTFLIRALQDAIEPLIQTPDHAIVAQAIGIREPSRRRSHSQAERAPLRARADRNQQRAIDASATYDCSFIWGPPGTGKTWTIAAIVEAALAAHETILITSHTNVAVDNAILDIIEAPLAKEYLETGRIVRYGVPRLPQLHEDDRISVRGIAAARKPELQKRLQRLEAERRHLRRARRDKTRAARSSSAPRHRLSETDQRLSSITRELAKIYEALRELEDEILGQAVVIGTTFSKLSVSEALAERRFDLVVVDEASMAWVPQVMLAGLHASRLVITGDFRQLPPICLSDTALAQKWLGRDVFDHAGLIDRVDQGNIPPYLTPLVTQRRMHPGISVLANRLVYRSMLQDAPEVADRHGAIAVGRPYPGKPVVLVDTSTSGSVCYRETSNRGGARVSRSRYNLVSAALACEVAREAVAAARQRGYKPADGQPLVAVITPFAAQAKLLRRMLCDFGLDEEDAIASTVHRFQGSEADVVVFDCADGPPRRRPAFLLRGGFGSSAMRLINVAVTRARGKLVVVGNAQYLNERLDPGDTLRGLIEAIQMHGAVFDAHVQSRRESSEPVFYRDTDTLASLEKHLKSARKIDILAGRKWNPMLQLCLRAPRTAEIRWFVGAQWCPPRREARLLAAADIRRLKWHPVTSVVIVDGTTAFIQAFRPSHHPSFDTYRLNAPAALGWFISMLNRGVRTNNNGVSVLERKCPDHGIPLVIRKSKRRSLFLGCPKHHSDGCRQVFWLKPYNLNPLLKGLSCGNGHKEIVVRDGKHGWFVGCSRYPTCKWTADLQYLVDVLKRQ